VFVLAKVCVTIRVVTVQIHTHLVRIVCGSSWLGIVFVKPLVRCWGWQYLDLEIVASSFPLLVFDSALSRRTAFDDRNLFLLRSAMSLQFRDVIAVSSVPFCWSVAAKSRIVTPRSAVRLALRSAWPCY
jgi:hypothetical protein